MKKTTLNTALILLLSLGVAACGSKHNETVLNSAPNTTGAELAAVKKQLAEAEAALANATQNSSAQNDDLQANITALQSQLSEAQNAQAQLQSELEAATTAAAQELATVNENANAQLTAAQTALTQAQAESANLQKNLTAAQAELAQAQQAVADLKVQLAQAAADTTLQTQLSEAQTKLSEAQTAVSVAEAKVSAAEAKASDAEAQLAAQTNILSAYQAKEKVWADSIAANLSAGGFGKQADSYTYAYLNNEAKKAELISAMENRSSVCNQATSGAQAVSCTAADIDAGTVLFTKNNTHSGYAVVREAFDSSATLNTPKNSYVAIVKTPTSDKTQVLGASYSGSATYTMASGRNGTTMVGENLISPTAAQINAVNFNVDAEGKISGGIWNKVSPKEENHFQTVEFKQTDVLVGSNGTVFSGDALIKAKMTKNSEMISGSYQGAFAGSEGQELIGTFSSDSTHSDYIHGAFSATKDSAN